MYIKTDVKSIKILGIADLHDRAEMLDSLKTNVDLIAFCGDLHNASHPEQARPVAEALAKLGPPVLIVPGNMDHKDIVPQIWKDAKLKMIHCSSYRFGDYGFIGIGGMVPNNPRKLGDPARYYHSNEEIYESLAKLYREISDLRRKIVLTHQPPRGARDMIYNGEISGSLGLRRFIEEFQPDLLMCGHIHEDIGEAEIGRTKIINVGELREGYAALVEINEDIRIEWIEP
ncbi:MAG: metallophosphoesterase [Methanotrichaceae archaeon]